MPKIHDLKSKSKAVKTPFIEILGPIDCGKTQLAQLVARRLGGVFFSFPSLDPMSVTGRALLTYLTKSPKSLEKNPEWWSHIYAANLYENLDKIKSVYDEGTPVVVTNYIRTFSIWMRVAHDNSELPLGSFFTGLPDPTYVFNLIGNRPLAITNKPIIDFSYEFRHKINRALSYYTHKCCRIPLVELENSKYPHASVNAVAVSITSHLKDLFKLPICERELYTHNDFPAVKKG